MAKQGLRQFNPPDHEWTEIERAYLEMGKGYWKKVTIAKKKGRPLRDGFKLVWIWDGIESDFPAELKDLLISRLEEEDLELEDIYLCYEKGSPTILQDAFNRGFGKPRQEDIATYYPIVLVQQTVPKCVDDMELDEDAVIAFAEQHGSSEVNEYDLNPPPAFGLTDDPYAEAENTDPSA